MADGDSRPPILISAPVLAWMKPRLERFYEVRCLWEETDLSGPVRQVRAIVAGGRRLDRGVVEALPDLGLIAVLGAGYDMIDVAHARSHGVAVTNTPSVNADDVAEQALALLLALLKDVVGGDALVREGRWSATNHGGVRRSLKGAHVGIVGLGAIGMAAARRLEPFGAHVAWWGPRPKPEAPYRRAESLQDLACESDVLLLTANADASNKGMIDAAVPELLGPKGLLVNVARGSLVDEPALIAALKDGRLGGAGLDVFVQEPTPAEFWQGVPNTVLAPHAGGNTRAALFAMTDLVFENLRRFFADEPLVSPVP